MRGRLLERLQERVPGRVREHVRLVEDVDAAAAAHRRERDVLAQLADVVDGVVRGRVHLDHVERRALRRIATHAGSSGEKSTLRASLRRSARRRAASPCSSCRCRASRRTGTRGGPCPARSRSAACGRCAPGRPPRRRCGGGGGGRGRARAAILECGSGPHEARYIPVPQRSRGTLDEGRDRGRRCHGVGAVRHRRRRWRCRARTARSPPSRTARRRRSSTTCSCPTAPPPSARCPVVLQTHGWGGTGATDIDDENDFIKAGYGVLTWDQRGFGGSGGKVHIDSPAVRGPGRDAADRPAGRRPARGARRQPATRGSA